MPAIGTASHRDESASGRFLAGPFAKTGDAKQLSTATNANSIFNVVFIVSLDSAVSLAPITNWLSQISKLFIIISVFA